MDEGSQNVRTQSYGTDAERSPSNNPGMMWLLWGGFVMSHLLFGALGAYLRTSSPEPAAELPAVMPVTVAAVAFGCLVSAFVVPRFIRSAQGPTLALLRWSLVEAITIFGLVLVTLGATWQIPAALWVVGLSTHLWLRPGVVDVPAP